MTQPTQIVAIDGPAGAGKSTVARRVAAILGFAFLDTGAMYRAATWWAVHKAVDLEDSAALAENTGRMQLLLDETPSGQRVLVNSTDITDAIRTPEITRLIYRLDQIPAVREQLVELQRAFGARQPTVAEGRDMGTVVFPGARCKIYLDASLDERTRRRARDLREKGYEVDETALRREIHERDEQGMTRATSPLRPADDAVRVDTSELSQDEVVERIVQLARERL
jgi:cytidylate kinase